MSPPRRRSRFRVPTAIWLAVAGSIVAAFTLGVWLGGRWTGGQPPAAPGLPRRQPPVAEPRRPELPPRGPAVKQDGRAPTDAGSVPIALVIDDLGRSVGDVDRLLSLGIPMSFAVLPYESRTEEVAAELGRRGAEVLLHLPMQPEGGENPGPGALTREMGPLELSAAIERALAQVPGATGVNNHMGSGFTGDRGAMEVVVGLVGRSGRFYLDSRTSADSLGYSVARAEGVATAKRDVFLDEDPAPEAVRGQFHRLLELARREGSAIAIGHPHPATIAVLAEQVPRALEQGYRFVPVSALMERGEAPGRPAPGR